MVGRLDREGRRADGLLRHERHAHEAEQVRAPLRHHARDPEGGRRNEINGDLSPFRYRIPALMKDCTNWRWKRRNASSRGAEVMSVAAVMIDQSIPWSPEENT